MRSVSMFALTLAAGLGLLAATVAQLASDDGDALSLVQLRAEKRPRAPESKAGRPEKTAKDSKAVRSCVFTAPVRGHSPGTTLEKHAGVATIEECQRLCETQQKCRAVEHVSGDGTCSLLPRMFDGHLQEAPEGTTVTNKMVCGTAALALGGDGVDGEGLAFAETTAGSLQPHGRHRADVRPRGDGQLSTFTGSNESFIKLKDLPDTFGGPSGFSISFTSTWFKLGHSTHLIDFGNENGTDSIVVGNIRDTSGLTFYVNQSGVKAAVDIKHAIDVKESSRYLFSVEGQGHMRVFRDGQLIGENKHGMVPEAVPRTLLYVGKPQGKGSMYKGQLSDLCIWSRTVGWEKTENCISHGSSSQHSSPSLVYSAHILPAEWSQNPALA